MQAPKQMTGNQALFLAFRRAGGEFFATHRGQVTEPLLREFDMLSGEHGVKGVRAEGAAEAARLACEAAGEGATVLLATAGPALAACGEAIGRAQFAEVPLVLMHCQYLGGDESAAMGDIDVGLARHLTPGSLPLPVLAATDAGSTYRLALRAFEIAERLRTPIVLLTSLEIATTPQECEPENEAEASRPAKTPKRRNAETPKEKSQQAEKSKSQKVEQKSAGEAQLWANIPPCQGQGLQGQGVQGESFQGWEERITHLMDKLDGNRDFLEIVAADADPDAQTLLLSYGLADQAARQAVELVRSAGARVSHLTIHSLWPMPAAALRRTLTPYVCRVLVPELNTGLYADELSRIIKGVKIEPLTQFDGRVIPPETIARRITEWPCG